VIDIVACIGVKYTRMAKVPLISVVDDDESVRESLDGLLRSVGFAVKVFASAEEFLSSDHHSDIDCLLLDVRLPGMNGIELHRRLVADHCEIPVIFITAHGSEEGVRSQALRNGAVDYLIKPLSEDSVLDAVHKALSSKQKN
jgi:FixJ family two-component response regulator